MEADDDNNDDDTTGDETGYGNDKDGKEGELAVIKAYRESDSF